MSHLLSFNFDGSIARTFQPSPNGIGVHEAYTLAIHDIFETEGMQIYEILQYHQSELHQEISFQELFIENNMQIESVRHGHSIEGL